MLFRKRFLDGIRDGTITLAFRRWRRPTVRSGGSLLTPAGELEISKVGAIEIEQITVLDAKRAGYESRDALIADLRLRDDGNVYRIELGRLRPDPRIALRAALPLDDTEYASLVRRLKRFDAAAARPWTVATLETLRLQPAVRAGDLCRAVGQDKLAFKRNVRKLKGLGLTESLPVGYRLSPRGATLLDRLKSER